MSLTSRVNGTVVTCCLLSALAVAGVGGLGIEGVRTATASEQVVTRDELATTTRTAALGRDLDQAYAAGQAAALEPGGRTRVRLADALADREIPQVEGDLAEVLRIHQDDEPSEKVGIVRLRREWVSLRTLLNGRMMTAGVGTEVSSEVRRRYETLDRHVESLLRRETVDAVDRQEESSAYTRRIIWGVAVITFLVWLFVLGVGVAVARRLRRAIEPAQEQVEFSETLQLAEDETEAHQLLQRHLQRLVGGSTVTVLNRNNSADRLQAVTDVASGSPLAAGLEHAVPRSCLAVRSARVHGQDENRPGLLGCGVCGGCPGVSTCTPLTVGGEVIGSVLVNRASGYNDLEQHQVRDAVGQAAPVVANLRNLAIAELRAATDSLTGLPNKRAVGDTLKRMLAQASRTLSPFSLMIIDLDHFKDLNDTFGHQAGDQVLAAVGAGLRYAIRESDFAGRNGGEEFAVMLPDTDVAGAVETAEKIRAALGEIRIPGLDLTVSASIGVAMYPDHAVTPERLERLADSALFVAKRAGRDRIEVAAPSLGDFFPDPTAQTLALG